jgi:hypothetical protein
MMLERLLPKTHGVGSHISPGYVAALLRESSHYGLISGVQASWREDRIEKLK